MCNIVLKFLGKYNHEKKLYKFQKSQLKVDKKHHNYKMAISTLFKYYLIFHAKSIKNSKRSENVEYFSNPRRILCILKSYKLI